MDNENMENETPKNEGETLPEIVSEENADETPKISAKELDELKKRAELADKYKIRSEENIMEDLYKDIGKELYAIFKTSNHIDDSLLDYCNALKKIEHRIKNLEKELIMN